MTLWRMRDGRQAVLFVLVTPILLGLSIRLEQVDPHVPGKFAFLVMLGPTLLVAVTGKRWQGMAMAVLSGIGCLAAAWVGAGMDIHDLSTRVMSMPVLLGAALLAVGTMLTLRCDEAEQRMVELDLAVQRVMTAEEMGGVVEAIHEVVESLNHDQVVELFIWQSEKRLFVRTGQRSPLHSVQPAFSLAHAAPSALAPDLSEWSQLEGDLRATSPQQYCLPLTAGGDKVFGFLLIQGRPVNSEVGHSLQILASFAGLAIKNALLFERLRDQAGRDGLTGLANYATFQDALSRATQRTAEAASSMALVLMDLDEFKQVNDRHGHHFGSLVLQKLAEHWRSALPAGAVLARYGGDEFACILPHCSAAEARAHVELIEKILAANPVQVGDVSMTIKPSVGFAIFPKDAGTAEELFHIADQALYAAKRRRKERNCARPDATDSRESLKIASVLPPLGADALTPLTAS